MKRTRRLVLQIIVLLAIALTVVLVILGRVRSSWRESLLSADRVFAFRTSGEYDEAGDPSGDFWQKKGEPVVVPLPERTVLQRAIGDLLAQKQTMTKGCAMLPGFVVTFGAGNEELDVFLCFECSKLSIHRAGKYLDGRDFDAVAGTLRSSIESLFKSHIGPNAAATAHIPSNSR